MLFDTWFDDWEWPDWGSIKFPDLPGLPNIELPTLDSLLSLFSLDVLFNLLSYLTIEVGLAIVGTAIVVSLVSQRFLNKSSDGVEEEQQSPFIHTTFRSHCSNQFLVANAAGSSTQAKSPTQIKRAPSAVVEQTRRLPRKRPPEFKNPDKMFKQPIPVLVHPKRPLPEPEDMEKRNSLTDIRDTLHKKEQILIEDQDPRRASRMKNKKKKKQEPSTMEPTVSPIEGHPTEGPELIVENLPSGVDLETPIIDDGRTPPVDLSLPDKILITIGLKKDPDPEARKKPVPMRPKISATRKYTSGGVGDPLKVSPQFTSATPLRQQHRLKRTEPVLSGYADQQMVIAAMRRRTLPTKIKPPNSRSRTPSPDSRNLTSTYKIPGDDDDVSNSPPQKRSRTPSPTRDDVIKAAHAEQPTAIPKYPTIKKDPVKVVPIAPRIPKLGGKSGPKENVETKSQRELLMLEIRSRKSSGNLRKTNPAEGSKEKTDEKEVAPVKMGANTNPRD